MNVFMGTLNGDWLITCWWARYGGKSLTSIGYFSEHTRMVIGQKHDIDEFCGPDQYLYDADRQQLLFEGLSTASILCEKGKQLFIFKKCNFYKKLSVCIL